MVIQIIRFISSLSGEFFYESRIYFLWFIIYSFTGWLYESTICSQVNNHRCINRGFLKGPICPIYGCGAVVNILLLSHIGSTPRIFAITMITSGVVEYFTSYSMEKLFHQRWWDYTRYRFNLQGRICLYGCVIFGAANVIILKFIHPFMQHYTDMISDAVLTRLVIVLYITFLVDVIYTTVHMQTVNERMRNWARRLQLARENLNRRKEVLKEDAKKTWDNERNRAGEIRQELRVYTSQELNLKMQRVRQTRYYSQIEKFWKKHKK